MARLRYPKGDQPLPPPLPPEQRTVGQLVAEAIKVYGRNFWRGLATGALAAIVSLAGSEIGGTGGLLVVAGLGALLLTLSYLIGVSIVHGGSLWGRPAAVAYVAGVLVFLPFPFLATLFILPGLAWLALFGLAVPAAFVEELGLVGALRRATQLARADFVHALGSLTTLAILVGVTQFVVFFLLREYADNTLRIAAVLSYAVMSPLLFLGTAVLYEDQVARHAARG